ncbi:MAG: hypothetical protein ACRDPG_01295, partial [Nocardioidaceae bacterium]
SSIRVLRSTTSQPPGLPPDWATMRSTGAFGPATAPGAESSGDPGSATFSINAARIFVWSAACPGTKSYAARAWPFFATTMRHRPLVGAYDLRGRPAVTWSSPVMTVAAAAAADAAGRHHQATALMQTAHDQNLRGPTYYGSAWVALGLALLTPSPLDH